MSTSETSTADGKAWQANPACTDTGKVVPTRRSEEVTAAAADYGLPVSEKRVAVGPATLHPRSKRGPRILLVATVRWTLAARLAIAFRSLGCPVQAWCPAGHPLEKTRAVDRFHRYRVLTPLRSLSAAIAAAAPDLIVPCDDDAALQLQQLHDSEQDGEVPERVRSAIRRSLGKPASCRLATARGELMDLARAEGVRIPAGGRLSSTADLDRWGAASGFPAVIKVDRSWGGRGVTVVRDSQQAHDALQNARSPSLLKALSHLVLRRDPSYLLQQGRMHVRPSVTVQKFIVGSPANRAVACWQGEVLAGISVMALQTQSPTGPATVVRIIDNVEMAEAARRLVRALGLSGFCGLDFVIGAATGAAYLIEVNPRATPISHLPLGAGHHLPIALFARLQGKPAPSIAPAIGNNVIAMFPGEWRRDPLSPYLRSAYHDVPWAEIALVRDGTGLPWEDRGMAARVKAYLSRKRSRGAPLFPMRSSPAIPGTPPDA